MPTLIDSAACTFGTAARAIREKLFGSDHPSVSEVLHELAAMYRSQGRYGEAEPFYRRTLTIDEKTLGPTHPNVSASLHNLASLLRQLGRYDEAEPLQKRSLAIAERAFGPRHSIVAERLNGLAARGAANRIFLIISHLPFEI